MPRKVIFVAGALVLVVVLFMLAAPSVGGGGSIFVTLDLQVLDERSEIPLSGTKVVVWDVPQIGGMSGEPIGGPWTSATTDATGKARLLFRMGTWRAKGTFYDTYYVPDSEATVRISAPGYTETRTPLREYLIPGQTSNNQEIAVNGIVLLKSEKTGDNHGVVRPRDD